MSGNVLELKHIGKSFGGIPILKDIDFTVERGTFHALLGENGAGKSTLMKIVCGTYTMDQGEYLYDGQIIKNLNPRDAIQMGISMIQQELSPIPEMTIAENIFLYREPMTKLRFVDDKKMNREAKKLLEEVGMHLEPSRKMSTLTVAEMQMVEIVKAISRDASVVIMDEPTSSLTDREIEALFREIEKLKKKGVAIIYITHKLDEVFKMSDEITIMRDGEKISTGKISDYNMERIITEMVGRAMTNIYPERIRNIGKEIFRAEGLQGKKFKNISFHVNKGEIVGFSGLVGAGRTEVARAIFGLDDLRGGKLYLKNSEIDIRKPSDAIKAGIAFSNEDRKVEGLVLCRSIRENISMINMEMITSNGIINMKKDKELSNNMVKKLNIKLPSIESKVQNISGGNQQKVVLAKWLSRDMTFMILDEPTRGIYVGAKYDIYNLIGSMAKDGLAVMVISSEIQELMGICDRIYVMSDGEITGELAQKDFSQENIMRYAIANTKLRSESDEEIDNE